MAGSRVARLLSNRVYSTTLIYCPEDDCCHLVFVSGGNLPLCYISHKAIYGTTSHYTIGAVGSLVDLYILCSGTSSVLFGAWYLYWGAGRLHYKYPCFTAVIVMAGVCAVHFEWRCGRGALV